MKWQLHLNPTLGMMGLLMCSVFLSACTPNHTPKAQKYDSLEQATLALNTESEKIDLYIAKLGQAKTEAEKKQLACEKIPQQFDLVLAIVENNQHLMSAEDLKVQAQFKHMAEQQKARFTSSLWCKGA